MLLTLICQRWRNVCTSQSKTIVLLDKLAKCLRKRQEIKSLIPFLHKLQPQFLFPLIIN